MLNYISSCPYDMSILNYVLTYAIIFFSLTTCQENVFQITMKMHGSNLIHFTFVAPAVKFLHLMKLNFQLLKISMEDVMVIT